MARIYSHKHGKAGSKKLSVRKKPVWLRYDNKEIELLIVKLAKAGKNTSEIGMILRDSYGIPDVKTILGKRLTQILKEKGLAPKLPEDLVALIKQDITIMKHMEKHKKDMTAKRGLQINQSKINRLVKYYKRQGKLLQDWKYDRKEARLYVG